MAKLENSFLKLENAEVVGSVVSLTFDGPVRGSLLVDLDEDVTAEPQSSQLRKAMEGLYQAEFAGKYQNEVIADLQKSMAKKDDVTKLSASVDLLAEALNVLLVEGETENESSSGEGESHSEAVEGTSGSGGETRAGADGDPPTAEPSGDSADGDPTEPGEPDQTGSSAGQDSDPAGADGQ